MNSLKTFISEEEEEKAPSFEETGEKTTLAEDSVDDQIDAYLLKFEKESMKQGGEMLENSLLSMSLAGLLAEQEDEDNPDTAQAEPEAEEPAAQEDDTGTQDEEENEEVPDLPPIDLVVFSKKVVRLVKNVQYLLDIERAVVARSLNYIRDNYDQDHVDTMIEVLESRLGFAVDDETGDISAPFAVGAWAGGTGGLGGAGA